MASNAPNPFLDLALRYVAKARWLVFPLRPHSKSPFAEFRWKEQASGNTEQVREWWTKAPTANLAVVTGKPSNILVIDIDPHNGGAVEVLADLCGGSIPQTLTARTGREGWHYYFRYPSADLLPEGWEITVITGYVDDQSQLRGLARGIDVKGTNGYVLAPPSIHPETGATYRWDNTLPIKPLPTPLLERILAVQPPPRRDTSGSDEGIVAGGRNNFLASIAGKLRRDGMNETEIMASLRAVNDQRCRPPLPDAEVEAIARSIASRYAPAESTAVQRHNQREEQVAQRSGLEVAIPDAMRLDRQEQEIIACILLDAELPPNERGDVEAIGTETQHDLLTDVCTILQPAHFFTQDVRLLFETVLALVERGEPYALACVDAELRGKEGYVGPEVLTSWMTRVANTAWDPYLRNLCQRVLDASRKRRLLSLGLGLQRDLVQGEQSVASLSTKVREQLEDINLQVGVADNHLAASAQNYRQMLAGWRTNSHEFLRGESSGVVALDKLTGGLQPGKVWLVGARASMGKTAYALSCALVNAERYESAWRDYVRLCQEVGEEPNPRKRKHVAIVSLEMDGPNLVHRFAGMLTGIAPFGIMRGVYDPGLEPELWHTPVDDRRVNRAVDEIARLPILMVDAVTSVRSTNGTRGRLNTHTIAQRVRAWQQEHSVGLVIVDYLQLVKPPEEAARETRERQVAAISEAFKALALERHVPVMLLAQLNRTVEHRDGRLPQLSDIRESGAVEHDIDVALLLFRKEYYQARGIEIEQDKKTPPGVAQLWVAKHRDGATGVRDAFFDAPVMRYYDYDEVHDQVKNWWGNPIQPEMRKSTFPHGLEVSPSPSDIIVDAATGLTVPPKPGTQVRRPLSMVASLGGDDFSFPADEDDELVEHYTLEALAEDEPPGEGRGGGDA